MDELTDELDEIDGRDVQFKLSYLDESDKFNGRLLLKDR
jgi:hypothetical protein